LYIPKAFDVDDLDVATSFMQEHNFATLITQSPTGLDASHLPFVVQRESEGLPVLFAHLARANSQWQSLEGGSEVLVVFQGPHAYVSPSLYETHPSVPTWNYQAVHATGMARLIEDPEGIREHVMALVEQQEAGSQAPWYPELPEDFLQSMLRQIVAIRIDITRIEAKFKLSQNRPRKDRENVAAWFVEQSDPMLQALGRATHAALG
jgi:transcriptional regulator